MTRAAGLCLAIVAACGGEVAPHDSLSSSQDDASTSATTSSTCNQRSSTNVEASDIALDADAIFALAIDDSSIRRISRCDGAMSTIAASPQSPLQIALDDDEVYWVASEAIAPGVTTQASSLTRVSKNGGEATTLRTGATPAGALSAVALRHDGGISHRETVLFWIQGGALWSAPLGAGAPPGKSALPGATLLAPVPAARGQIVFNAGYVYVPEYDIDQFTFDVRRIDPTNPNDSVVYPGADASSAIAFFEGNVYVDGEGEHVLLATPNGTEPSPLGEGFAVVANSTDLYLTTLGGGGSAGNALYRVDVNGARTFVESGGALGPSIMAADDKAVAWTDGGTLHFTPLGDLHEPELRDE